MNQMKRYLKPVAQPKMISTALLILRLVMGFAFVLHGWGKIQNPFSWAGPQSPFPGIFLLLAAIAEFGGGISMILGFLTPAFSVLIAVTMTVATGLHAVILGDPFVSKGAGAYELALVYAAISLVILTVGPGKFSVDSKVFGERK